MRIVENIAHKFVMTKGHALLAASGLVRKLLHFLSSSDVRGDVVSASNFGFHLQVNRSDLKKLGCVRVGENSSDGSRARLLAVDEDTDLANFLLSISEDTAAMLLQTVEMAAFAVVHDTPLEAKVTFPSLSDLTDQALPRLAMVPCMLGPSRLIQVAKENALLTSPFSAYWSSLSLENVWNELRAWHMSFLVDVSRPNKLTSPPETWSK